MKKKPHEILLSGLVTPDDDPAPYVPGTPIRTPLDEALPPLGPLDPQQLAQARHLVDNAEQVLRAAPLGASALRGAILQSLGLAHMMLGDLAGGRQHMEDSLRVWQQLQAEEEQMDVLFKLARYHQHHGEAPACLQYYARFAALARDNGQDMAWFNVMAAMTQIHLDVRDYAAAARDIEEVLPFAQRHGLQQDEMSALAHLGLARYRLGELAPARDASAQAMALSRELGDTSTEEMLLGRLVRIHFELGEYRESAQHEELLLARERGGDPAQVCGRLCNLGVTWFLAGDPARSQAFLEEALPLIRAAGDRSREATVLANLANAYLHQDQTPRAAALCQEAISLQEQTGDCEGRHVLLSNLAEAYLRMAEPHRALPLVQEALGRVRQGGDRVSEGKLLSQLGDVHMALGTSRRALDFYRKNLEVVSALGDRLAELDALERLGLTSAEVSGPRRALKYFEWMLAIAREAGDAEQVGKALFRLGSTHWVLGERERAVMRMQEAQAVLTAAGSPHKDEPAALLAEWQGRDPA